MASANFTNLARALALGRIQFDNSVDGTADTFKVMLVSSIPSAANLDAWANRSDVTNEVTGAGYTAGGIAQAFTLSALDTTNNRQEIIYTNIVNGWTASTISAVGAIIYRNSGVNTTDTLMHFIDFVGTVSSSAGNFSVTYTSSFYVNA
jgi:hypothetical protein